MADGEKDPKTAQAGTTDKPRLPHQFKPGADNPRNRPGSGSGRVLGVPNKLTTVKQRVLAAFDRVGGEDYLVRLARSKKDRSLFTQLLAKTIPQEVTGANGGPIELDVLRVAKIGLTRLDDAELVELQRLLVKAGVNEVAVNDDDGGGGPSVPALPAPAEPEAAAG